MRSYRTCNTIGFIILAICLAVILSTGDSHAAYRLYRPSDVYYHRFASNGGGTEALWTNPAALGYSGPIRFLLIGDYVDDSFADKWGGVVSGDRVGIGYRRLENIAGAKYEEYQFGAGSALGQNTMVGVSYVYVKHDGGAFDGIHMWNIGVILVGSPRLHLGAVFSNLNHARVLDQKTDMEEVYSISYHPQKMPIWFSVEMSLSSGQSLSSAKYTYGIEGSPIDRLQVYADYRNGGFFSIGVTYFLDAYFGGAQTKLNDDGDHLGTSLYGGYFMNADKK